MLQTLNNIARLIKVLREEIMARNLGVEKCLEEEVIEDRIPTEILQAELLKLFR